MLGEYPELTARGIPLIGTENYGGLTAGGVIFIGATAVETFRVFDKETGEKLPFGGNGRPSTYAVNGRQFVVISAGEVRVAARAAELWWRLRCRIENGRRSRNAR